MEFVGGRELVVCCLVGRVKIGRVLFVKELLVERKELVEERRRRLRLRLIPLPGDLEVVDLLVDDSLGSRVRQSSLLSPNYFSRLVSAASFLFVFGCVAIKKK